VLLEAVYADLLWRRVPLQPGVNAKHD